VLYFGAMPLTPKSYSLDIVFARTSAHIIQKNESELIRRWVRQLSSLVSDFAVHEIQRMQSELAEKQRRHYDRALARGFAGCRDTPMGFNWRTLTGHFRLMSEGRTYLSPECSIDFRIKSG